MAIGYRLLFWVSITARDKFSLFFVYKRAKITFVSKYKLLEELLFLIQTKSKLYKIGSLKTETPHVTLFKGPKKMQVTGIRKFRL